MTPAHHGYDMQLFNPENLVPRECAHCGATLQPNETRAPHCAADRDQQRRPRHCLNRTDPSTTEIPY